MGKAERRRRMSGGLMTGGLKSCGLMFGGLKSYDREIRGN